MENFRLILYILIGVIYVFYRLTRKSKAPVPQKTPAIPSNKSYNTSENKTLTYKQTAKPSSITKQAKDKFEGAIAKKQSLLNQEKVIIPVENYEHKSVEKPVGNPVNKSVEKKEEFKPYSFEQTSANPYAELLQSPEGIKAAFIASEIMQRKYE